MASYQLDDKDLAIVREFLKFEGDLFWKRCNQFWLVQAAALAGYITLIEKVEPYPRLVLTVFGVFAAVCWFWILRGSRYQYKRWYEQVEGRVPINHKPKTSTSLDFGARNIDPVTITTALSFGIILVWVALLVHELNVFFQPGKWSDPCWRWSQVLLLGGGAAGLAV